MIIIFWVLPNKLLKFSVTIRLERKQLSFFFSIIPMMEIAVFCRIVFSLNLLLTQYLLVNGILELTASTASNFFVILNLYNFVVFSTDTHSPWINEPLHSHLCSLSFSMYSSLSPSSRFHWCTHKCIHAYSTHKMLFYCYKCCFIKINSLAILHYDHKENTTDSLYCWCIHSVKQKTLAVMFSYLLLL